MKPFTIRRFRWQWFRAIRVHCGVMAIGLVCFARFAHGFDADRLPFVVELDGLAIPYRLFSYPTLPGSQLRIRLPEVEGAQATASGGRLVETSPGAWQWVAPRKPGLVRLILRDPGRRLSATIHLFVLVPQSQVRGGWLNGYRIGGYPLKRYRGLAAYAAPQGFIEVTPDNAATPLTPHFSLEQFLCKQEGDFPKYVALRPRLLLGLERVLEHLNTRGVRTESLFVMSGFRTPHYNRSIGNGRYSRHIFGDAVDIFIDESPVDGKMDDLNGDGRSDVRDAQFLSEIVAEVAGQGHRHDRWSGGIGIYQANLKRGPFVHLDLRGYSARWIE